MRKEADLFHDLKEVWGKSCQVIIEDDALLG